MNDGSRESSVAKERTKEPAMIGITSFHFTAPEEPNLVILTRERGYHSAYLFGFWTEREVRQTAKSGQLHLRLSTCGRGDLYCGFLGVWAGLCI